MSSAVVNKKQGITRNITSPLVIDISKIGWSVTDKPKGNDGSILEFFSSEFSVEFK